MIVLHEYPLSMVEHIGFRKFCSTLQPLFKPISRNAIKVDIIKLYGMERMRTAKLLAKIPSHVAITTNMWTASTQNKGYMYVTAHFIDDQWILQSRLIRFMYVPAPHTAENLCHVLVDCLYEWNLDRKISSLTIDNCSTNDAMIECVFEKIPTSSFVMKGSLFHLHCCAHILNLIVKEGLSTIESSIQKTRDSVGYWVATPKREEKFEEACRQLNMEYSKKLVLDCRTRWNSTYLMITSALPYQDVFDRLGVHEREYKCVPSEDDRIMAIEICDKLKVFYSVTELFSSTQYPTANAYFPKICEIRLNLSKWIGSENLTIRNLAADMIVKFDKYWGLINGVMAVGAVLDPRYKMKLLNYFFSLMYGFESDKELRGVRKLLEDLLSEYQNKDVNRRTPSTPYDFSSSSTVVSTNDNQQTEQWQVDFLQFVQETDNEDSIKSELDSYLEEGVLIKNANSRDFDILCYWKNVGVKYPNLQRIARDFLAIPISTVASESAFSTSGRVLSPHRSRLHPSTVEAMMCTQDWLRSTAFGSSKGKVST